MFVLASGSFAQLISLKLEILESKENGDNGKQGIDNKLMTAIDILTTHLFIHQDG